MHSKLPNFIFLKRQKDYHDESSFSLAKPIGVDVRYPRINKRLPNTVEAENEPEPVYVLDFYDEHIPSYAHNDPQKKLRCQCHVFGIVFIG